MSRSIWALAIGLNLVGCGLLNTSQSPNPDPSPQLQASDPAIDLPISASPDNSSSVSADSKAASSKESQLSQPVAQDNFENSNAERSIQQDYEPTTPLPETGKLTVRGHIRSLDPSRLITNCPTDSAPFAFAESTNYRVQICSEEYDPWMPKYYLGQAKDGSGELRITNSNRAEAQQLIFKSNGYTYSLDREAARPEEVNAYLQVFTPNGDSFAEALLYFYEATAAEAPSN